MEQAEHGDHDRGRGRDDRRLAEPLRAERRQRRGRHDVRDLDRGRRLLRHAQTSEREKPARSPRIQRVPTGTVSAKPIAKQPLVVLINGGSASASEIVVENF